MAPLLSHAETLLYVFIFQRKIAEAESVVGGSAQEKLDNGPKGTKKGDKER